MGAIQDLKKQQEIRNSILSNLLMNLNESRGIGVDSWDSNVGPLVDLCAADTGFNNIRSISESERHRYIRVLSKSIQLLNSATSKQDQSYLLKATKDLIYELAELYTDIAINTQDTQNAAVTQMTQGEAQNG